MVWAGWGGWCAVGTWSWSWSAMLRVSRAAIRRLWRGRVEAGTWGVGCLWWCAVAALGRWMTVLTLRCGMAVWALRRGIVALRRGTAETRLLLGIGGLTGVALWGRMAVWGVFWHC